MSLSPIASWMASGSAAVPVPAPFSGVPAAQPVRAPDCPLFSRESSRRLSALAEGSGYVSWITRLAVGEVSHRRSSEPLTRLLRFLETGGTVYDYEALVGGLLGPATLSQWPWYVPAALRMSRSEYRLARDLPLSRQGRVLLARALDTLRARNGGRDADSLPGRLRNGSGLVWNLQWLEKILRAAERSPLAALRLERLGALLETPEPLMASKLAELGDPELRLTGTGSMPFRAQQRDAYLGDISTTALLFQIETESEGLMERSAALSRHARRRRILADFLEGRAVESLRPKDLSRALRLLGDAKSVRVAGAIDAMAPQVRPFGTDFDSRVAALFEQAGKPVPKLGTQDAFYFHRGLVAPRAVLALRIPPLRTASDARPEDVLFEILATIVHEWQHHDDAVPEERKTATVVFRLELRAHAREFLWRADHGDTDWLWEFTAGAPLGFALRFRDHFDRHYSPRFRQVRESTTASAPEILRTAGPDERKGEESAESILREIASGVPRQRRSLEISIPNKDGSQVGREIEGHEALAMAMEELAAMFEATLDERSAADEQELEELKTNAQRHRAAANKLQECLLDHLKKKHDKLALIIKGIDRLDGK